MILEKGTEDVPFLFFNMERMELQQQLEAWIEEVLGTIPGYFPVELKVSAKHEIRVFVDADQGVSINELAELNRALRKRIDESGLFPEGDFSLELSSPGLDEPLKLRRQYQKNQGRKVEVLLDNGSKRTGTLLSVGEEALVLEEQVTRERKKVLQVSEIPFNQIKYTKVCVVF